MLMVMEQAMRKEGWKSEMKSEEGKRWNGS